jgi:hypothetical protein
MTSQTSTIISNDAWIEIKEYAHFHTVIYNHIKEWMTNHKNQHHQFYRTWTKAMYLGVSRTTSWSKIAAILSISTITEYIALINQCPHINERIKIHYDANNNIIKYYDIHTTLLDQINTNISEINRLHQALKATSYHFDSTITTIKNEIQMALELTTMCSEKVNTQIDNGSDKITMHCAKTIRYFVEETTNKSMNLKTETQKYIDETITSFQQTVTDISMTTSKA